MINPQHKSCLVCLSNNLLALKGYEKHNLVKCAKCGLVFMKQIPTNEELNKYYSVYSYSTEQPISLITIKRYNTLLDEFEKFRETNNLLDVGCGQGFFLDEAKKRGWNVFGTEFSPAAVAICKKKNIETIQGKLNPKDFSIKFDVITSFEIIEHINTPIDEIIKIHQLLRTSGLFYCTTPNWNSIARKYLKANHYDINYPEHLIYFTKTTLKKLLKLNGFYQIKFSSTGFSPNIFFLKNENKNNYSNLVKSDNVLRENIESNITLKIGKFILNYFLKITNLGIALKGYYIKQN